jgi:hypothetical protein
MTMMTVFSRIHILAENVRADTNEPSVNDSRMQNMLASPAFVIQQDAFEMMKRADCGAAVQALQDADILRLPYEKMVVEWCINEGRASDIGPFIFDGGLGSVEGEFVKSYDQIEPIHEFVHMHEETHKGTGKYFIVCEYAFLYTKSRVGGLFADKFGLTFEDNCIKAVHDKRIHPRQRDIALAACVVALNAALVLMNMRGIEREVHTNAPLNKQRVRKGKPAIRDYSYLHIGHVYRSDGTRVKYTEGDHRTMPMHVRSAHTRNQVCGEGRLERRLVYIPSVIVNGTGDLKNVIPKQRIIKT